MDSLMRFLFFLLVAGALLCCGARAAVPELDADGKTAHAAAQAKMQAAGLPRQPAHPRKEMS